MKMSVILLTIGGTVLVLVVGILIINMRSRSAQQVPVELINAPQPEEGVMP